MPEAQLSFCGVCNHVSGGHSSWCTRHPSKLTSAARYAGEGIVGRADADIRPSGERYYPLDRPLPGDLEPTVDSLMTEPVPSYVQLHRAPESKQPVVDLESHADIRAALNRYATSTASLPPSQSLPTSALARKELPLATGLIDYFPAALIAVAGLSRIGNEQHNPGEPMHWARGKSGDEADALLRHLVDRGTIDSDGIRHSTKVAWRALALLQKELEDEGLAPLSRGSR